MVKVKISGARGFCFRRATKSGGTYVSCPGYKLVRKGNKTRVYKKKQSPPKAASPIRRLVTSNNSSSSNGSALRSWISVVQRQTNSVNKAFAQLPSSNQRKALMKMGFAKKAIPLVMRAMKVNPKRNVSMYRKIDGRLKAVAKKK